MRIHPTLDTSYPALILKASRRTIHHGVLDVARSLGRLGVPVCAIVEDRYAPLATSRYVTQSFVWKTWPADRDAFLNAMANIGERINRPTILFPMDDLSAIFVAENSAALPKCYLCPPLSWSPRQLANKAEFYALCSRTGTPIARTVIAHSVEEVREFSKSTSFPMVVKAADQWRLIQDRFSVKIIRTRDALSEFCARVNFAESGQIILQEYVPGDDWIYHGYCNSEADLYLGFTGKKLLDYPPGAGATALGLSFANDSLRSHCKQFLRAISYSGIIDIDCRLDHRDGQYKIMDCNPRVGMNFRMFENTAGIDVVRAQHLNLTGRSFDCAPMVENKLFVVESYYLLSVIRGWGGAGKINVAPLNSPRRREFAWWSSDDMLPFVVMSGRLIVQTTIRTFRYMWSYVTGRFKR